MSSVRVNEPVGELRNGLAELGIVAHAAQIETLLAWLRLLRRWNRAFNLTAIPPARQPAELVLTSAAAVAHLNTGRILDVGSGAGVPGIPLAILAPDNGYTLLDGNGKKTRFLKQCRAELGLENVTVEQARVETYESAPFDTIVARAFANLPVFFDATRRLSHAGTRWLAFKGGGAENEVQHLPRDRAKWRLHGLRIPGQLPGGAGTASLVIIQTKE